MGMDDVGGFVHHPTHAHCNHLYAGPGKSLYTTQFYELLKSVMRPGGAVAVQGGSFFWFKGVFNTVYHQLDKVFPVVKPYQCFTAIYPGGVWNLQVKSRMTCGTVPCS